MRLLGNPSTKPSPLFTRTNQRAAQQIDVDEVGFTKKPKYYAIYEHIMLNNDMHVAQQACTLAGKSTSVSTYYSRHSEYAVSSSSPPRKTFKSLLCLKPIISKKRSLATGQPECKESLQPILKIMDEPPKLDVSIVRESRTSMFPGDDDKIQTPESHLSYSSLVKSEFSDDSSDEEEEKPSRIQKAKGGIRRWKSQMFVS